MTTNRPDDDTQAWSPPNPFAPPSSSGGYAQPTSPDAYAQPTSPDPYAQPTSPDPYAQPTSDPYGQRSPDAYGPSSDAPTRPVPLPTPDPYAAAAPHTSAHPGYGTQPLPPAPAPDAGPALDPSAGAAPSSYPYRPSSTTWDPLSPWSTAPTGATAAPAHRRTRRRRTLGIVWLIPLVLLSLLAGAAGGVLAGRADEDGRLADAGLPVSVGPDEDVRPAGGVAGIADAVLPSVVSIEVASAEGQATGSGFVLRQDGYLLTNNHVIAAGAQAGSEIRVLFSDGSEEPATVVGRTGDYDIAVLKVDRTGLTPLLLADSDDVVVGDPVVAIGAPLGLKGTVTTGIVSALNRPVAAGGSGETAFINAIQTDAAINPGNSGGPLVNAAGEVVGINSAIAQPPGGGGASGSIGLGFAIPSNQARRTAEQLIETGAATYPIIGVLLDQTYTGEGVQVASEQQGDQAPVTAGGPAEDAGIRPGDVIVAIDGRPVTEPDELIVSIRAKAPGDAAVLTVRSGSDSEERDVRVVLDEATSE